MGKPTGFMEHPRRLPERRPVGVRLRDWHEVYEPFPEEEVCNQASRCMDCGIPFCHEGCPLGNLIPEWNDLVWRDDWFAASERLHATNNFPEVTGRLCPAPCEGSCVLGINAEPVTIERIEEEIAERAFAEGWVRPQAPQASTGKSVGIVGSGPSGLACAQQLARAGHSVVVYERAERPGGLMRYGIPEFKMEKHVIDRRLAQLRAEGVEIRCATSVGLPAPGPAGGTAADPEPGEARGMGSACAPGARVLSAEALLAEHDALVLALGSTVPRDLEVPGRGLRGVHFAMEYLKPSNLVREGVLSESPVSAAGKHVVIIGGGDTGADCLGTAHRQGAHSVHQLEIMERPPDERAPGNPWPTWPLVFRTSSAHEEGGERLYSVTASELVDGGDGAVAALRGHQVAMGNVEGRMVFEKVPGSDFELPCELVLLAMGFLGPERRGVVGELGLELDPRGNLSVGSGFETSRSGVFACGDAARGQSLIVWAIAEGRSCASGVDRWLMGETDLPGPIRPGQLALRASQ